MRPQRKRPRKLPETQVRLAMIADEVRLMRADVDEIKRAVVVLTTLAGVGPQGEVGA